MRESADPFRRTIDQQIAINQSRTPSERFLALCQLLDFARSIAPTDPQSIERRRQVAEARQREKEKMREQFRQWIAAGGWSDPAGAAQADRDS